MANKTAKPEYVRWYEEEFQADLYVRRGMTWLQRHFYRALCIAACFCDTRPYLPDDDEQLWLLADAESPEMWKENRPAVVKKFQPVVIDGVHLLAHKRVLKEWDSIEGFYEQRRQAGINSGKVRAQRSLNDRSTGAHRNATVAEHTETETDMQMETEEESGSGSGEKDKTNPHPSSVHPGSKKSVSGEKQNQPQHQGEDFSPSPVQSTPPHPADHTRLMPEGSAPAAAAQVRDLWNEIVHTIHTREDAGKWHYKLDVDEIMDALDDADYAAEYVANSNIVNQYGANDVLMSLIWAFRLSNHWWKNHKGHIRTWGAFCGVYEIVRQQRDAFFNSVEKRTGKVLTMDDILALGEWQPSKRADKKAKASAAPEPTVDDVEEL